MTSPNPDRARALAALARLLDARPGLTVAHAVAMGVTAPFAMPDALFAVALEDLASRAEREAAEERVIVLDDDGEPGE